MAIEVFQSIIYKVAFPFNLRFSTLNLSLFDLLIGDSDVLTRASDLTTRV